MTINCRHAPNGYSPASASICCIIGSPPETLHTSIHVLPSQLAKVAVLPTAPPSTIVSFWYVPSQFMLTPPGGGVGVCVAVGGEPIPPAMAVAVRLFEISVSAATTPVAISSAPSGKSGMVQDNEAVINMTNAKLDLMILTLDRIFLTSRSKCHESAVK
jgi:hypothetical protein